MKGERVYRRFFRDKLVEDADVPLVKKSSLKIITSKLEISEKEKLKRCLIAHIFSQRWVGEMEKRKTPQEKEALRMLLNYMIEFVESYGGEAFEIPLENIHLIDPEKLSWYSKRLLAGKKESGETEGRYCSFGQFLYALVSKEKSRLRVFQNISHELLHFFSFQSFRYLSEGKLEPRRVGIGMACGKEELKRDYFHRLNDGLTEMLVQRFDQRYFSLIPYLKKDLKERERMKERILKDYPQDRERIEEIASVSTTRLPSGMYKTVIENYGYPKEREELKRIISKIYSTNRERFSSIEEVFTLFAKAYFQGPILEIARLIEKTFGKGTFSRLAKDWAKEVEDF